MARKGASQTLDLPLPQLSRVCHVSGVGYLTDEAVRDVTGTRIAFLERTGGVSAEPYDSLNLGLHVDDDPACVRENRLRTLAALGAGACAGHLLACNQVHGSDVVVVDGQEQHVRERLADGADAVVCLQAGIPVLLFFADCLPVILVAPGGGFAIAHAGWRGALVGIAGKTLEALCAETGCMPDEVNAYIGPHIGACCYEVSDELLERFVDVFGARCDAGMRHLSLSAAVREDLLRHGMASGRIIDPGLCTRDGQDRFFSHRGSGGRCGRHGAMAVRLDGWRST
ncbi:MAG: polyphenol oxidase family protein [Actinomycetota bacterium]|nr:polyphenol oxidase family protein [Actinomycetota bacterium]